MNKKSLIASLFLLSVCIVLGVLIVSNSATTKGFVSAVINNDRVEQEEEFPYPSIQSIFELDHTWTATLSADKKIVLIATGDIIPARSVNYGATTRNDYTWPYEKTASFLKDSDVTFANLETPLLNSCMLTNEGMIFCGNERNVEGLVFSGIDIVSLANNHAGNYGEKGVLETVEILNNNGIKSTGIKGPEYITIKGVTFAFLGYNDISKDQPGVKNAEKELIRKEISEAKNNSDFVIVTFHWGAEYRSQPDNTQKELAHFTMDSGADLIIGNHPHWIQPIELYKPTGLKEEKLITYAHGNFVFDQMWSLKTRQGVVGKYIFYGKQLVDVEYFPVQIEEYGQPFLLTGETKKGVLKEMEKESISLAESFNNIRTQR